jgi:hypothetical protein
VIATYYTTSRRISRPMRSAASGRTHPNGRAASRGRSRRGPPCRASCSCCDDRLLAPSFVRRISRDRLGITPDEIDGGQCVALSRPRELAGRLKSYLG